MNADIRRIADEYMKYRSISTHLIGFDTDDSMGRYSDVLLPSLSVGSFSGVRGENGEKLAVGYMKAKDGKGEALMIAASDDPYDENKREVIVVLRCGCTDLRAFGTDGGNPLTKEADGSYRLRLRSCGGALVTAEP